jgi:hypothetical protein
LEKPLTLAAPDRVVTESRAENHNFPAAFAAVHAASSKPANPAFFPSKNGRFTRFPFPASNATASASLKASSVSFKFNAR